MPLVSTRRPDPLQLTRAGGAGAKPIDPRPLEAEIRSALATGADVPGRIQDGPTCGLYALGMVMDFFDVKDSTNLNPLVQASDATRRGAHSRAPDSQDLLFETAKASGYTTQGEMFHTAQLAQLARQFGYEATVTEEFTFEHLKASVDRGNPALVGFDVDDAGNPGNFEGLRAHWAVVEGYFEKDGVDYVVATHGWTGAEYVWRASDLIDSAHQLKRSNFPAAPSDISQTIGARMIEVADPTP